MRYVWQMHSEEMPWASAVLGFPGGSDGKESACNAGDAGSIPGWGRSPGEGRGYPLQYACLEKSMDRGAWRATVHGITKSRTRLSSSHTHTHTHGLAVSGSATQDAEKYQELCDCPGQRQR